MQFQNAFGFVVIAGDKSVRAVVKRVFFFFGGKSGKANQQRG